MVAPSSTIVHVPVRRARERRARVAHVRELRARADEDVLAEHDAVPHARVALDARARADDGARRDEAEGADDHVGPELRPLDDDPRRVNARGVSRSPAALHRAAV